MLSLGRAGVNHLATVREKGSCHDLVIGIDGHRAALYQMEEESQDVTRVDRAGVGGHRSSQVGWREDQNLVVEDLAIRLRQFAVATLAGG